MPRSHVKSGDSAGRALAELVCNGKVREDNRVNELITISSTFTAEPLQEFIEFWLGKAGMGASVQFAPYNQVFQSLLDPTSILNVNRAGLNVVLVRFEDWEQFKTPVPDGHLSTQLQRHVQEFATALERAASRTTIPTTVFLVRHLIL